MQFGFAILLARLLTPHDFGLMALMVVFVGISSALVDGGFGAALVQRDNPSNREVSAVLYFNIAVGAAVGLVLVAGAGWIACFFDEPVLEAVSCAAALNVFVTSFGVVQLALLVKMLDFRAYFFVTVLSSGPAGALAVLMAWQGFGVWSLVAQSLTVSVLSTFLLWHRVKWRPDCGFHWNSLVPMWRFGAAVMLSGVLEMLVGRLPSVVIGRVYSVSDLGLYSRADSTRDMGLTLVSRTVTRVAFPVFSAAAGNQQLLLNALRKTLRVVMYFNFPGMVALCVLAPQLIPFVYGGQWAASVPFLQILAIAGLLAPMCLVNLELLKSTGRSGLYFRAEMVKKSLMVLAVLVTFSISILAMAWGQLVAMVVFFALVAYSVGQVVEHGLLRQLRDLWQPALATLAMLLAIWGTAEVAPVLGSAPLLLAQIFAGGGAYFAACALMGSDIQRELLGQVWALAMRRLSR